MTVSRIKWVIIMLLFFVDVVVFYVGYSMGSRHGMVMIEPDIVQEINANLPGECESVRGYAAHLEDENSWLVKIWMKCDVEHR